MVETVSVRLDDDTLDQIRFFQEEYRTDRSEIIRRMLDFASKEMKKDIAIKMLKEGKVSIGRAAEFTGISIYEVLELCKERHVHVGYKVEDFEKDLKRFGL